MDSSADLGVIFRIVQNRPKSFSQSSLYIENIHNKFHYGSLLSFQFSTVRSTFCPLLYCNQVEFGALSIFDRLSSLFSFSFALNLVSQNTEIMSACLSSFSGTENKLSFFITFWDILLQIMIVVLLPNHPKAITK